MITATITAEQARLMSDTYKEPTPNEVLQKILEDIFTKIKANTDEGYYTLVTEVSPKFVPEIKNRLKLLGYKVAVHKFIRDYRNSSNDIYDSEITINWKKD